MTYTRLISWVLAGLVLAVATLETAVRWSIGASVPERLPLLRVRPDAELGYRPIPGDQHYAYEQLITLNHLGLRGAVPPQGKSLDEHRIVVLGDSQVYGMGVADPDLFTARLERSLSPGPNGRGVSVLNFGVRGYALNQQLVLLESIGLDFAPDTVVVAVFMYSFFARDINAYYNRVGNRDWYMLDLDARPEGLVRAKWHLIQLARASAVLSWLHDHLKARREETTWLGDLRRGLASDRLEKRFAYFAQELDRFAKLAKANGFVPVLVVLPIPDQLKAADPMRVYQARVSELAQARGIAVIDTLDSLRQASQAGERLLVSPFSAHYSPAAHRVIAEELERQLPHPGGSGAP